MEPCPEPLDRDWGSTLSRADLTEVAGILRRLRDEQINLGLGTFNLLLKREQICTCGGQGDLGRGLGRRNSPLALLRFVQP